MKVHGTPATEHVLHFTQSETESTHKVTISEIDTDCRLPFLWSVLLSRVHSRRLAYLAHEAKIPRFADTRDDSVTGPLSCVVLLLLKHLILSPVKTHAPTCGG
jgi:hypothetical protein